MGTFTMLPPVQLMDPGITKQGVTDTVRSYVWWQKVRGTACAELVSKRTFYDDRIVFYLYCPTWQPVPHPATKHLKCGYNKRGTTFYVLFICNLFVFKLQNVAAAAAAKSLQSCPTLCDPIDGSPPGSSVPGILQARTLEWVAISFSSA